MSGEIDRELQMKLAIEVRDSLVAHVEERIRSRKIESMNREMHDRINYILAKEEDKNNKEMIRFMIISCVVIVFMMVIFSLIFIEMGWT